MFTHDVVVFDLEATSQLNERGFQINNYIIDIGAVYLSGDLVYKGEFSQLVKPKEPITPFVEKLTGISNEMVEEMPDFATVGDLFSQWVNNYTSVVKRIRLAAWGAYFDGPLLRRVYETYAMPFPFSGTIIDIKSIAMVAWALLGKRTDQLNLTSCATALGITELKQKHRALTDAQLTAEVLKGLWTIISKKSPPFFKGEGSL